MGGNTGRVEALNQAHGRGQRIGQVFELLGICRGGEGLRQFQRGVRQIAVFVERVDDGFGSRAVGGAQRKPGQLTAQVVAQIEVFGGNVERGSKACARVIDEVAGSLEAAFVESSNRSIVQDCASGIVAFLWVALLGSGCGADGEAAAGMCNW